MKNLIAAFLLLLAFTASALQFTWDKPLNWEPDGYLFIHGTEDGKYSDFWPTGTNTTIFITADYPWSLPMGPNYFTCIAYGKFDGQSTASVLSNQVCLTNYPAVVLETVNFTSTNLVDWQPFSTNRIVFSGNPPQQFFRGSQLTIRSTNQILPPHP